MVQLGTVYTRPEVVEYMLGAVGLPSAGRLQKLRILEPSCGEGAFVLPLLRRLVADSSVDWLDDSLAEFLCAVDVSGEALAAVSGQARTLLREAGCPAHRAEALTERWFRQGDFLLMEFDHTFDVIVGNPPYIRYDDLTTGQQEAYRRRFVTFAERSDIYVPFLERSLDLLSERGVLAFICSNRFTRSSYGQRLRRKIAQDYHVRLYLNLEQTQPFQQEVSAYPGIFVIGRSSVLPTYAGTLPNLTFSALACAVPHHPASLLNAFEHWYADGGPWLTTSNSDLSGLEAMRQAFPSLGGDERQLQIGIGVATGADQVFVLRGAPPPVEEACLLPLIVARDIHGADCHWSGHCLVNPFETSGELRRLEDYPRLRGYLLRHEERLRRRYCARQHPQAWYRTLDRVSHALWRTPKVLLPDIQQGGSAWLDEEGCFYPHHNVYWVTSDTWNLRALTVLLRSEVVTRQMRAVSVAMRGGSLRYQAQTLRQLHLPTWDSLTEEMRRTLVELYDEPKATAVSTAVGELVDSLMSQ